MPRLNQAKTDPHGILRILQKQGLKHSHKMVQRPAPLVRCVFGRLHVFCKKLNLLQGTAARTGTHGVNQRFP